MATQKVQYQVEIAKVGDGAIKAAAELQQVQVEAEKARVRLKAMSAEGLAVWQREAERAQVSTMSAGLALGTLGTTSSRVRDAIQGLGASARLIGFTVFPEATGAAVGLKAGYDAVRNSAAALGVGMSRLLGPIAIVGTTVYAGVEYWRMYKAQVEATGSALEAYVKTTQVQVSLEERLQALKKSGLIDPDRIKKLQAGAQSQKGVEIDAEESWAEWLGRQVYGGERKKTVIGESDAHYQARIHRTALQAADDQKYVEQQRGGRQLHEQAAGVLDTFKAGGLSGEEAQVHATEAAYKNARKELQELGKQGVTVSGLLAELDTAEADRIRAIHDQKLANNQQEAMQELDAAAQRIEHESAQAEQIRSFRSQMIADSLSDEDRVRFANLNTFQERMRQIQQLSLAEEISGQQELDLINAATAAYNRQDAEIKKAEFAASELGQISQQAAQQFSAGFSNAFLDFVSGTKSAGEAFKEFASSFLRQIAQMIMQTIILNAIKSTGLFAAEGGTYFAAQGGVYPRMMAMGGVASVSQPTYFPRFNVVAGEAGPEMLTVLARPRMMQIGGVEAAVGNAGPQRLAITDAAALAGRSASGGGSAEVLIRLSPGLEGSITQNSIEGARVRIVRDMKEDSELSQTTRKLVS
jgi:hypothetical protein